jgi:hypothetical protein
MPKARGMWIFAFLKRIRIKKEWWKSILTKKLLVNFHINKFCSPWSKIIFKIFKTRVIKAWNANFEQDNFCLCSKFAYFWLLLKMKIDLKKFYFWNLLPPPSWRIKMLKRCRQGSKFLTHGHESNVSNVTATKKF